jgi:hypothetical protein
MTTDTPNPFEQAHPVALYKSLKYGYVHVSAFYGERDAETHSGMVRISEPATVTFKALAHDEAILNALKTLDAEERNARLDLDTRLNEIKQQRASLLALTYQPEVER